MANEKRRLILRIGVWIIAAWYLVLLGFYVLAPRLTQAVQARAKEDLRADFGSEVRFQSFKVSWFPRMHVLAGGVLIGNNSACPLIQAASADAQSDLLPWHVRKLVLQGLSLHIPTTPISTGSTGRKSRITVGEIVADRARVEIMSPDGRHATFEFELAGLRVKNFDPNRASAFAARLVSSHPRAEIQSTGSFGPWNTHQPGATGLSGKYTLPSCDLATIPGLQGMLASQGRFEGVLQRIQLAGDANAGQMSLTSSGHPESLHATFGVTVDASDGSASIQQMDGTLQTSPFHAVGLVRNIQDDRLRDILLELSMKRGRLEDVLPLGVRSAASPISGPLQVRAKLQILPGDRDILARLRLDADFAAPQARFSSLDLREQLRNASRKAVGHPKDAASGSSLAAIQGHVAVSNGVANFSRLNFDLEGASARLHGSYELAGERLDLQGQVAMAAKVSQTATGAKAFVLKAADPFFRHKGGGSLVPIRITGTRSHPAFGLDLTNKR
jgi:hypothetical protein